MLHQSRDAFETLAIQPVEAPENAIPQGAPAWRGVKLTFAVVIGLVLGCALGLVFVVVTGLLPILC
jgi:hypothetical protein